MKTKHPESKYLPEAERNIMRQYDEILCRRIELGTPWTYNKLLERISKLNIGKLYVDMKLEELPPKDSKSMKKRLLEANTVQEGIKANEIYIAVKIHRPEKDIVRLIDIDYNHFIDIESNKLEEFIYSNDAIITHTDKALEICDKQKKVFSNTLEILNLTYDYRNKKLRGFFSFSCTNVDPDVQADDQYVQNMYSYKLVILKKLIHSRSGEIFYKVYVTNAMDLNDKGVFLSIRQQTLFTWDKMRLVEVLLPEKYEYTDQEEALDIFPDDDSDFDEQDDSLSQDQDIIDDSQISEDDDLPSWMYDDETDDKDKKGESEGVLYNDGQLELMKILGNNTDNIDNAFQNEIVNFATGGQNSYDTLSTSTCDYEIIQNSQNERYRLPNKTRQTLEECFNQCLWPGVIGNVRQSERMENNFVLRVYEENANRVVEQILEQGLFDTQDFPKNLKSSLLQTMKKEAFEFCEGLYPPGVELSLIDMLQVYRILVPYFFNRSRRYINYLRQCYSSDGLKCNITKRDDFIRAVPISVFNQVDMNSKKYPEKFVDTSRNIEYKLEGTTYKINFIAKCALTGFEQCFRGLALGNRFQEEPDMRKQFMINKHNKEDKGQSA